MRSRLIRIAAKTMPFMTKARSVGIAAPAGGERRLLWVPVLFGAGIGFYFELRVEPPLWPCVAAAIAGAGLSFALRRHPEWCEVALAFTGEAMGKGGENARDPGRHEADPSAPNRRIRHHYPEDRA
jgi:hypothetical protein